MRVITRGVISWETMHVLEEESFEYCGPVAACKSSGNAPNPVDPYTQANAQLGLAEGTANYNAGLNRTSSANPLGASGWNITGKGPSGAPIYGQSTSLSPWANQMLSSPIDTSNVPGAANGPDLTASLNSTRNAAYNQQMGYLGPQQALQSEQTQSQLANQGAMPGSAAYDTGMRQLNQGQTFQNQQAIDSAIGAGNQEQATLYGLGSQGLQNQLAVRNAPISEYEQLMGNGSGGQVSAATPDISGAFGQQYQGQLAGYNANTATNNANTQAGGAAASAALMAALFASDRRVKKDIEKVGKLDSGLNVYRYKYKGSERSQIGVMAQEAEKVFPESVFNLGGTKYVNYGGIS
jgi:hypothetical protein